MLDFETVIEHPDGQFVFMRAPASGNHHDIALCSRIGPIRRRLDGRSHHGRPVPPRLGGGRRSTNSRTIAIASPRPAPCVGASDHGVNKSLYAKDPDGLEFEVMWLVPPDQWGDEEHEAIVRPLDLAGELLRFAIDRGSMRRDGARLDNQYCHFFDDDAVRRDRP